MNKLIFIYESQAFFADFHRGKGFPFDGMERMATIAHKHKIPVTWLTNGRGAEAAADRFTTYHKEFGDEVSLWLMPHQEYKKDQYRTIMKWSDDQLRDFITMERNQAKSALPWANLETCGFFFRNNRVIRILTELGFTAVYGACWHQYLTDSVDDVGIPFGDYYMDPTNFKRPAPAVKPGERFPLISNEWLTHDMNKVANYPKCSSIYTTDPNDVNNNGICYPGFTDYWHRLFDCHYASSQANIFYPFVLHQESHEMLNSPQFQLYSQQQVNECTTILEDLLNYVTDPDRKFQVEFMTVPAAVAKYRQLFHVTQPMMTIAEDIDITTPRYQSKRAQILEKTQGSLARISELVGKMKARGWVGGPYPPTAIYYDHQCQLKFRCPQSWPVEIRNYNRPEPLTIKNLTRNTEIFLERTYPIPTITQTKDEITITLPNQPKPDFPYAIMFWSPGSMFAGTFETEWRECIRKLAHLPCLTPNSFGNPTEIIEIFGSLFQTDDGLINIRPCWSNDISHADPGVSGLLFRFNLSQAETVFKIRRKS